MRVVLRQRLVDSCIQLERRERKKERKALGIAKLDKRIEEELLSRLRTGKYKDIYNFPLAQYENALEQEKVSEPETVEFEEDYESDEDSDEQLEEEIYEEVESDGEQVEQTNVGDIEDSFSRIDNSFFDDSDKIQEEVDKGKDPRELLKQRWSRKVSKKERPLGTRSRKRRRELEYEVEDERWLQQTNE